MARNTPRSDLRGNPTEILLVEDNSGDVRLIEEAFDRGDADVALEIAADGAEAIELLSRRRKNSESLPDLVLLDLNMPRMDGFEVLDAIRDDPDLPRLPILVLTGSTDREDVLQCYDKSANAYLAKPQSPEEIDSLARAIETFWIERAVLPPTEA